jgi:ABC-2 type transport system ATP-binding protein
LLEALGALDGVERADPVDDSAGDGQPGSGGDQGSGSIPDVRVRLYLTGDAASMVAPVARLLNARQASLTDVRLGSPSLEDVFIHLTGRSLR